MPGELDDIRISTDCPRCGATVTTTYEAVRLFGAAACGCGALLQIEDHTPLSAIQRLIDEANPVRPSNDC